MGENKMKMFFFDKTLYRYEQSEQWDRCLIYLKDMTLLYPKNKTIFFSLAAYSWYVLTFWDICMPVNEMKRHDFELMLSETYMKAQHLFWEDSNCLWMFGYFMRTNFLDFAFISADFRDVIEEGDALIKKAYLLERSNKLAEMMYYEIENRKSEYNRVKKEVIERISDYFPNKSEIDNYFTEVFTSTF